jgi:hypothetical protein
VVFSTEMLQAQIDIVDEAGHTEESVTIVGSGRVSLGQRPTGGYLHADEADTDLAVIVLDLMLSINVKIKNALRLDTGLLAQGPLDLTDTRTDVSAVMEGLRRRLHVKQVLVNSELWSGGAVIHTIPSSLIARAEASAARGAIEVSQQLERLRDQGKIDERGNILVALPADMKPDSSTNL